MIITNIPSRFTYDPAAHRYRAASGKFLSASRVHGWVMDYSANVGRSLRDLTQQLRAGSVTLAEWQLAMAQSVKDAHVAAAIAAKGGRAQMTQADWGHIGQRLRIEYGWLSKLSDGISSGAIPMDGRIVARAEQYGRAARETYWRTLDREMRRRGIDEVRNERHASDSCDQCIEAESLGWTDPSRMSYPGTRTCRANCLCVLTWRNSITGQVFG